MGNTGRPLLSSGTGVIRRRGCADGRHFLDVLAIIDDVTSLPVPEVTALFAVNLSTVVDNFSEVITTGICEY